LVRLQRAGVQRLIIHAECSQLLQARSPHGQETYLLRKVNDANSHLEAGGAGLVGIYNDLAPGAVYSVRSMPQ